MTPPKDHIEPPPRRALYPGERAILWAKALGLVCAALASLLGYTNRDHIAKWAGLAEVDGKTEVTKLADIVKFSHEMRAEIERIDLEIAGLKSRDRQNLSAGQAAINRIRNTVKKWHDE